MNKPKSTNEIRQLFETLGAPYVPSISAIAIVATEVSIASGNSRYWELKYSHDTIRGAIIACVGVAREDSCRVFAGALRKSLVICN